MNRSGLVLPFYRNHPVRPSTSPSIKNNNNSNKAAAQHPVNSAEKPKPTRALRHTWLPLWLRRYLDRTLVRSIIELRIHHVQQIFNSFDPSPFHERDIDADAEQYILGMAEAMEYDEQPDLLQINVHLGQLPSDGEYSELFKKRMDFMLRSVSTHTVEEVDAKGVVLATHESPLPKGTASTTTTGTLGSSPAPIVRPSPPVHPSAPSLPLVHAPPMTSSSIPAAVHVPHGANIIASSVLLGPPSLERIAEDGPARVSILTTLSEDLKVTLQNHFSFQAHLVENEIKRIVSTGRRAAVFGFLLLVGCIALSQFINTYAPAPEDGSFHWGSVASNALEISAWVSFWKPVEMLLYGWWPLMLKRRILRKLSRSDLRVFQDPHQFHHV